MKGFKSFGKTMKSGFAFPTKAGFTASSGKVQQVQGYTRAAPKKKAKFADGGSVGNSVVKRGNPPITEFDKRHGGTSDLHTGYSRGGRAFNSTPLVGDCD